MIADYYEKGVGQIEGWMNFKTFCLTTYYKNIGEFDFKV